MKNHYQHIFIGLTVIFSAILGLVQNVTAETIQEAMISSYYHNKTLNAQRAAARANDEEVAKAFSGYYPKVNFSAGIDSNRIVSKTHNLLANTGGGYETNDILKGNLSVTLNQTLYDWGRTKNLVSSAEAGILTSKEILRNVEQNVLLNTALAYLDVRRDTSILHFFSLNLKFLEKEVEAARIRFKVGESTRTDFAQADARRAEAVAKLSSARANLKNSKALYLQTVGHSPHRLQPVKGIRSFLPKSYKDALKIGIIHHPEIIAALRQVDRAEFSVRASESDLLPRLSLTGSLSHNYQKYKPKKTTNSASVGIKLTIPLYQGGLASALVRQSKEKLGQFEIELDKVREKIRTDIITSFNNFDATKAMLDANKIQLRSANIALESVIEERKLGQRTTLDVLVMQKSVLNAQTAVVQSERNEILAIYKLLAAIGRLNAKDLKLKLKPYNP